MSYLQSQPFSVTHFYLDRLGQREGRFTINQLARLTALTVEEVWEALEWLQATQWLTYKREDENTVTIDRPRSIRTASSTATRTTREAAWTRARRREAKRYQPIHTRPSPPQTPALAEPHSAQLHVLTSESAAYPTLTNVGPLSPEPLNSARIRGIRRSNG